MSSTGTKLEEARRANDPTTLPPYLIAHANTLLQEGAFEQARDLLDEAATIHDDLQNVQDHAHCLHLASTASRFSGDLEGSLRRATRAVKHAQAATPVMVSSFMELGETAQAMGDPKRAITHYQQAFEHGVKAGMLSQHQAEVLRRQAQAQSLAQLHSIAGVTLHKAYELACQAEEQALSRRILIEEASAWLESPLPERALPALKEAERLAEDANDNAIRAELYLLRATICLREQAVSDALEHAIKARELALLAVQPIAYVSAAIAVSEISDRLGDRLTAYGSLAVGLVTLADLMGSETANVTFKPKLKVLLERWGRDAFILVRDAFTAQNGASSE